MEEWTKLFKDKSYQIVRQTPVREPGSASPISYDPASFDIVCNSGVVVSTVWLGLNHAFGDRPPLIFETMIINSPRNENQYRYSTEKEAIEHHERLVKELSLDPNRN